MYSQLSNQPDNPPPLTAIVVFVAFTIEAYINSVGAKHLTFWDEIERLPWRKKVEILHKHSGATANWGSEPLQFAVEVFRIRDCLAHGKPERVLGPAFQDSAKAEELISSAHLKPDWFRSLTRTWAIDSKDRLRVLLVYLGALYGAHESDHLLHATGGLLIEA